MPLHIVVPAKQVIDPEMPPSAFKIDTEAKSVVTPPTFPPVVNGFDEYALEAALRIKDQQEARITVVSVGDRFDLKIMRKTLAMGADNLILCQDAAFANTPDSFVVARVLQAAVGKIGDYDLIICGRQASDWDNAQVPLYLAELLDLPCLPLGQKVEVVAGKVQVEQLVPDGFVLAEAALPALVTVSNELGEPRYPTMRNIMTANRKRPTTWRLADLDIDPALLTPQIEVLEVAFPERGEACEFIEAEDVAEAARQLAQTLRDAGLI